MKTTKSEFDRFWEEVLGSDWCLEDPEFDDQDPSFVLDDSCIAYQGFGQRPETPPPFVKAKELESVGHLGVGVATLFKRWHAAQTSTSFTVEFTVPKEEADALRERLMEMGGRVL
jgi:hypothetical protein